MVERRHSNFGQTHVKLSLIVLFVPQFYKPVTLNIENGVLKSESHNEVKQLKLFFENN